MGVLGQLGNQEEPQQHFRKGLFPRGTISIAMKSRVRRESHARFCERLVVKSLRPTRPNPIATTTTNSKVIAKKNCRSYLRPGRGFGRFAGISLTVATSSSQRRRCVHGENRGNSPTSAP